MLKSIIVLTLIGSLSCFGSFREIECGSTSNVTTFVSNELSQPCDTVEGVLALFNSIEAFSWRVNPISLFVEKSTYVAQASISGLVLLSERQMAWGETKSLKKSKTIWAHEYGHVLFNQKLRLSFSQITSFYNYMSVHDSISIKALNPYADNYFQIKNLWNSEAKRGRDIQKAYSELFADLVAALYINDKGAMKFAMTATSMPFKEREKLRYYDFNSILDFRDYIAEDPHFALAPVKTYIGQELLNFPMSNQRKRAVLVKVFKAINIEINKVWGSNKKLEYSFLNVSLINTLKNI